MSDLMLLGVLRMPVPYTVDAIWLRQFVDRARQAADRIEADADEITRLRAEVEALRADAERYRFMRAEALGFGLEAFVAMKSIDHMHDANRIDATIDAARKA